MPAAALTTGPQHESARWRAGFVSAVVADAQSRGLSREAVGGPVHGADCARRRSPRCLRGQRGRPGAGAAVLIAGIALFGWIKKQHPQRETPAGMEAASRWLGVRAEIAENPVFATHSPLQVELWDRLLAYGAALGVASGASRPAPDGRRVRYGGVDRVRRSVAPRADLVSAPLATRLGSGSDRRRCSWASAVAVGAGLILYVSGPSFLDAGAFGVVPFAAACIAVVLGAAVVVMAAADWRTAVEVTGPILRLRAFGDDEKLRYYVAVDDGESESIRAWKVSRARYEGLEQGDVITARLTRNLCCVRWIIRAETPPAAG